MRPYEKKFPCYVYCSCTAETKVLLKSTLRCFMPPPSPWVLNLPHPWGVIQPLGGSGEPHPGTGSRHGEQHQQNFWWPVPSRMVPGMALWVGATTNPVVHQYWAQLSPDYARICWSIAMSLVFSGPRLWRRVSAAWDHPYSTFVYQVAAVGFVPANFPSVGAGPGGEAVWKGRSALLVLGSEAADTRSLPSCSSPLPRFPPGASGIWCERHKMPKYARELWADE